MKHAGPDRAGPAAVPDVDGACALQGALVTGHAYDPQRPELALVVELFLDGVPCGLARAELFSEVLHQAGVANPFHGFAFTLAQGLLETASAAEVRLANGGPAIGPALRLPEDGGPVAGALPSGHVEWRGGLRFGGWVNTSERTPTVLRGFIDEDLVVEQPTAGWASVRLGGAELSVPAFDLHLPARFGDGRAHHLVLMTEDGLRLPPGPVSFVAFADGLEQFLASRSDVEAEAVRGASFDRQFPASVPFSEVERWTARFLPPGDTGEPLPSAAVVLFGEEGLDATLDTLGAQDLDWTACILPFRDGTATIEPADLRQFLAEDGQGADVLVFATSGTLFRPRALDRLVVALVNGGASCAYADVLHIVPGEASRLSALTAFDLERTLEQGAGAWLFALRREVVEAALEAGADSLFGLFVFAAEANAAPPPLHLPGFLAAVPPPADPDATAATLAEVARRSCAARGILASVTPARDEAGFPTVRLFRHRPACTVSVVILSANDGAALRRCLGAVGAQVTEHRIEVVVIDGGSSEPEALLALDEAADAGVAVVRVEGPFNRARALNRGAEAARGSDLLFLDQSVALVEPDAIDELVSRCAEPGVVAAAGLITGPDGIVAEAGRVLNHRAGSSPALAGFAPADPGFDALLRVAHTCSAASADFLLLRRDAFLAVGGADEARFPLFLTAESLCLALQAGGGRVIVTPHARGEKAGREARRFPQAAARFERELLHLRARWGSHIADDPFYSPLLATSEPTHAALAWPPRRVGSRRESGSEKEP